MKREDCILFSGGANGAEEVFGECAERFEIEEVNFTFEGHGIARERGLRVLNQVELKGGDVNLEYISKLMGRRYPETEHFRKIFQTIWFQIKQGEEVFVVGEIQEDGTVKGGTGWGAEFAKLTNKTLHVFDQARDVWFSWQGTQWKECAQDIQPHPKNELQSIHDSTKKWNKFYNLF